LCAALVQLGEVDAAIEIINDALPYWPTTDMRHYANVAISRRFGQGTVAVKLKRIYLELADVYEASLKDAKS
ncbi:MAG: hypothetical protein COA52_14705, partial [Hyphomicrobiales bacterium]